MKDQLDRIEDKLTGVDKKLDNHLERIAKVDESINQLPER